MFSGEQKNAREKNREQNQAGDSSEVTARNFELVKDFEGEGAFPRQVGGDHPGGAEFPKGAGKAEQDTRDQARPGEGEGDIGPRAQPVASQGASGLFQVGVGLFKGGPHGAKNQWKGDDGGGENHAGRSKQDGDADAIEPCAEAGIASEQDEKPVSDHNRGHDQGHHQERFEQGFSGEGVPGKELAGE